MAAPLGLASWIRFETVMDRRDWSTAIEMLVPRIHLPDEAQVAVLPLRFPCPADLLPQAVDEDAGDKKHPKARLLPRPGWNPPNTHPAANSHTMTNGPSHWAREQAVFGEV